MTDDPMDRYVRRELTPAEARELAQKSLDDSDLFEDLTASALVTAALARPPAKVVRFPRRTRFVIAAAAAAAAVVLISIYSWRPPSHATPETAAGTPPKPSLVFPADPGQPILLASGLELSPASDHAPVFRSQQADSRAPRPTGSIVSIEDGLATINLGSLDGLGKGSQVQVFRDDKSVGTLTVTAVFRERARTQTLSGRIQVNDQVRPPDAVYLDALMQQADAAYARGDLDGARKMAEKAAAWAETANPPAAGLERLAKLEYQLGSLQAAEKHYQSAGGSVAALNNLAVLRMLRGDYEGAEAPLSRAVSTKTDPEYARSANNLGVLAELRGDRRKAEQFYADALNALTSAPDSPERRALETNLARVRGVR